MGGATQVNLVPKSYYSHIPVSQEYFLTLDLDAGPAEKALVAHRLTMDFDKDSPLI